MTAADAATLMTIGHGASNREELSDRLHAADVSTLVDVRRFPGSRRNLDVSRDELEEWLPAAGIKYHWEERLGGRRRLPAGSPGSAGPDDWWRVEAFRAYAAYTRTAEFAAGMDALVHRVAAGNVAIMCSEYVWWRCHRRLIADVAVLLRDMSVVHVMPDGKKTPHVPSDGARVADGQVFYPQSPS